MSYPSKFLEQPALESGRPSNNTNASKNSTSTNLDSMRPVNYAWRGFSERNLSFSQHPQLVLNRHTQIHPSQSLECSPLDMPYSALASRFRHSIPLKSSYNPYWQASNPLIPQLPPESSGHYSTVQNMKYQPTTTNFSYHPAQNQDPFPIRTQQRPFLPPATHFSDAIHAQQMNPLLRLNPASQSVPDFMNLERLKSQHANHMVRISSYPQRSDFLYTNQGFKTSESGSNDQDREIDDNHSGQKQKNQMTINQKYVEPEKMSRSGKKSRFKGVSIAGHRWRATRGKVEIGGGLAKDEAEAAAEANFWMCVDMAHKPQRSGRLVHDLLHNLNILDEHSDSELKLSDLTFEILEKFEKNGLIKCPSGSPYSDKTLFATDSVLKMSSALPNVNLAPLSNVPSLFVGTRRTHDHISSQSNESPSGGRRKRSNPEISMANLDGSSNLDPPLMIDTTCALNSDTESINVDAEARISVGNRLSVPRESTYSVSGRSVSNSSDHPSSASQQAEPELTAFSTVTIPLLEQSTSSIDLNAKISTENHNLMDNQDNSTCIDQNDFNLQSVQNEEESILSEELAQSGGLKITAINPDFVWIGDESRARVWIKLDPSIGLLDPSKQYIATFGDHLAPSPATIISLDLLCTEVPENQSALSNIGDNESNEIVDQSQGSGMYCVPLSISTISSENLSATRVSQNEIDFFYALRPLLMLQSRSFRGRGNDERDGNGPGDTEDSNDHSDAGRNFPDSLDENQGRNQEQNNCNHNLPPRENASLEQVLRFFLPEQIDALQSMDELQFESLIFDEIVRVLDIFPAFDPCRIFLLQDNFGCTLLHYACLLHMTELTRFIMTVAADHPCYSSLFVEKQPNSDCRIPRLQSKLEENEESQPRLHPLFEKLLTIKNKDMKTSTQVCTNPVFIVGLFFSINQLKQDPQFFLEICESVEESTHPSIENAESTDADVMINSIDNSPFIVCHERLDSEVQISRHVDPIVDSHFDPIVDSAQSPSNIRNCVSSSATNDEICQANLECVPPQPQQVEQIQIPPRFDIVDARQNQSYPASYPQANELLPFDLENSSFTTINRNTNPEHLGDHFRSKPIMNSTVKMRDFDLWIIHPQEDKSKDYWWQNFTDKLKKWRLVQFRNQSRPIARQIANEDCSIQNSFFIEAKLSSELQDQEIVGSNSNVPPSQSLSNENSKKHDESLIKNEDYMWPTYSLIVLALVLSAVLSCFNFIPSKAILLALSHCLVLLSELGFMLIILVIATPTTFWPTLKPFWRFLTCFLLAVVVNFISLCIMLSSTGHLRAWTLVGSINIILLKVMELSFIPMLLWIMFHSRDHRISSTSPNETLFVSKMHDSRYMTQTCENPTNSIASSGSDKSPVTVSSGTYASKRRHPEKKYEVLLTNEETRTLHPQLPVERQDQKSGIQYPNLGKKDAGLVLAVHSPTMIAVICLWISIILWEIRSVMVPQNAKYSQMSIVQLWCMLPLFSSQVHESLNEYTSIQIVLDIGILISVVASAIMLICVYTSSRNSVWIGRLVPCVNVSALIGYAVLQGLSSWLPLSIVSLFLRSKQTGILAHTWDLGVHTSAFLTILTLCVMDGLVTCLIVAIGRFTSAIEHTEHLFIQRFQFALSCGLASLVCAEGISVVFCLIIRVCYEIICGYFIPNTGLRNVVLRQNALIHVTAPLILFMSSLIYPKIMGNFHFHGYNKNDDPGHLFVNSLIMLLFGCILAFVSWVFQCLSKPIGTRSTRVHSQEDYLLESVSSNTNTSNFPTPFRHPNQTQSSLTISKLWKPFSFVHPGRPSFHSHTETVSIDQQIHGLFTQKEKEDRSFPLILLDSMGREPKTAYSQSSRTISHSLKTCSHREEGSISQVSNRANTHALQSGYLAHSQKAHFSNCAKNAPIIQLLKVASPSIIHPTIVSTNDQIPQFKPEKRSVFCMYNPEYLWDYAGTVAPWLSHSWTVRNAFSFSSNIQLLVICFSVVYFFGRLLLMLENSSQVLQ